MKTVGKVILGVVLAVILLVGGCAVIVGSALSGDSDKDASASSGKQSSTGSKSDKGSDKSDPSVIGNWKIENFKTIKFTEEFGSFKSVPLKVRNVSDGADSPWFELRLTDKRGDLVAEFNCIGDEYEPGQGGTVDCSTLDDYKPFADWELRNAF